MYTILSTIFAFIVSWNIKQALQTTLHKAKRNLKIEGKREKRKAIKEDQLRAKILKTVERNEEIKNIVSRWMEKYSLQRQIYFDSTKIHRFFEPLFLIFKTFPLLLSQSFYPSCQTTNVTSVISSPDQFLRIHLSIESLASDSIHRLSCQNAR